MKGVRLAACDQSEAWISVLGAEEEETVIDSERGEACMTVSVRLEMNFNLFETRTELQTQECQNVIIRKHEHFIHVSSLAGAFPMDPAGTVFPFFHRADWSAGDFTPVDVEQLMESGALRPPPAPH